MMLYRLRHSDRGRRDSYLILKIIMCWLQFQLLDKWLVILFAPELWNRADARSSSHPVLPGHQSSQVRVSLEPQSPTCFCLLILLLCCLHLWLCCMPHLQGHSLFLPPRVLRQACGPSQAIGQGLLVFHPGPQYLKLCLADRRPLPGSVPAEKFTGRSPEKYHLGNHQKRWELGTEKISMFHFKSKSFVMGQPVVVAWIVTQIKVLFIGGK